MTLPAGCATVAPRRDRPQCRKRRRAVCPDCGAGVSGTMTRARSVGARICASTGSFSLSASPATYIRPSRERAPRDRRQYGRETLRQRLHARRLRRELQLAAVGAPDARGAAERANPRRRSWTTTRRPALNPLRTCARRRFTIVQMSGSAGSRQSQEPLSSKLNRRIASCGRLGSACTASRTGHATCVRVSTFADLSWRDINPVQGPAASRSGTSRLGSSDHPCRWLTGHSAPVDPRSRPPPEQTPRAGPRERRE
jgi:hypothetical protein